MANPVNWFHISVKEVEPIAKFYGEAFDWKMKPGPGGMVFIDTGKGGIPGGIATTQDGSDHFPIHIYAATDNIEAQLARVEKAGGKVAMPKMPLPEGMGWIAGFTDPAGNFVGLWEQVPQPKAPRRRAAAKAKKKAAKSAKKADKKAAKGVKKAAKKAKKAAAKKD
jgi:predicted enzyme related to lactoylglutathione lyase